MESTDRRKRRMQLWLLAVGVVFVVAASGFGWWIAHPLRASFELLPPNADACPDVSSCTPIHYRVLNHGFAHVYMKCRMRILDSDGRVLEQGILDTEDVPIGPQLQPWSTTEDVGWLSGPPPPGATAVDGSCSAIYIHGDRLSDHRAVGALASVGAPNR